MEAELSAGATRRRALTAQGFGADTVAQQRRPGIPALRSVARRLRILQVDPINVLVRSHYLPAYSRLGPYRPTDLDKLAYDKGDLFEYVGHEWSLVDTALHPHCGGA